MSKQIKDYLHLYLGCDCTIIGLPCMLFSISEFIAELKEDTGNKIEVSHAQFDQIKLILRPLSSITEEETKGMPSGSMMITPQGIYYTPELTRYLLSKGFDLFGLIESGLALDKTNITNHG